MDSVLGETYRSQVTTQSYTAAPTIDGVRIFDLRVFGDEGGDFCEIARLSDDRGLEGIPGFTPHQVSYSYMGPGTIKAWHLHYEQEDLWFVPPESRLLVGLLDVRRESPTYENAMRFMMGGGKAKLLLIPRGVAHGVANLSERASMMVYFTSAKFNVADPDERRLPFDLLGTDFWINRPG